MYTYYILLSIFLLLMTIMSYKTFKSFLSITFIVSTTFFISSIVAIISRRFSEWNFVDLKDDSIIIIILGILGFYIGEFIINQFDKEKERKYATNESNKLNVYNKLYHITPITKVIVSIFVGLSSIFIIYKMMYVTGIYNNLPKLINTYHVGSVLYSKSNNYTIGTFATQLYRATIMIGYVFIYFIAHNLSKKDTIRNNLYYVIILMIIMILSLINAGRMQFVIYFFAFASDYFYESNITKFSQISRKMKFRIIAIASSVIFIFVIIVPLLGRNSNFNYIEYLGFYIGGPIPTLQEAINTNLFKKPSNFGENTFSGVKSILYKFHIIDDYDAYQKYWIHYSKMYHSNIFTGFSSYYIDFGYSGVFFMSLVASILMNLINKLTIKKKNAFYTILYSIYFFKIFDIVRTELVFKLVISFTTIMNIFYLTLILVILFNKTYKGDYIK